MVTNSNNECKFEKNVGREDKGNENITGIVANYSL